MDTVDSSEGFGDTVDSNGAEVVTAVSGTPAENYGYLFCISYLSL